MVKIAFVIDTILTPAAGSEKQLLLLLQGLDRSRVEPHLVCLHNSEWLREQSFDFPVTIYDVYSVTSLRFWRRVRDFSALCRRERFDIVQTHFIDGNIFGTAGARLAGTPLVVSTRRNIGNWHNWIYVQVLRQLRRWTHRYLANSKAAAAKTITTERVDSSKIDVIYNGLDLSSFDRIDQNLRAKKRQLWNLTPDDKVIGIVANLRDVKNIDALVRATAQLVPEFPNLKVVSVGEGNYRQPLEQLRDDSGLTDRIQFVGSDFDIMSCLAAFDIGVLTSQFESFSNSLIEYMAAGLPIVASNVGGNVEAINHEETGLLYDVHDQRQLEDALRRILSDHELAVRLGTSAREKARGEFSREACLRSHEDFYERLLNERTHPGIR